MSSTVPSSSAYRPDIDGLRALAVLAVILFHIDARWLPGGFVGVDIFFVISGYLITGILSKEFDEGRFRFLAFYERRVRRILPALWLLLLVCIPISWWLMLPEDAEAVGKSAIWSIAAMANIYFWRDVSSDYFAPESAQLPFLHLWSLGVEEQFYLLWPLALLVVWRFGRGRTKARAALLAAAIVVGSTALAEWLLAADQARFAYYMLPTRAGELALGAFVALVMPDRAEVIRRMSPQLASAAAAAGWMLLAFSLITLSEHDPFPGWRALLPTAGAALLIVSGHAHPNTPWLTPLRWPASIWLGRCSYSAYLWHWPVLAWWRYLWGQPGLVAGLGLLALILACARASQRWIEEPARRAHGHLGRTFLLYGLLPSLVLASMATVLARGERWGLPLYTQADKEEWAALEADRRPAHREPWVCQSQRLDPKILRAERCEFGGGTAPARVLLLGDSHAAEFAPLFRVAAGAQGVRVRSVALGSCAALPGPLSGVVQDWRVADCENGMPQILERARDFPLLIIGGSWTSYARNDPRVWERLEQHLRELTQHGHVVWLLPRVAELQGYDAECAAKQHRVGRLLACPETLPQREPDNATNTLLSDLAQRVPGVHFLPLHKALCDAPQCATVDNQGRSLYADPSHLSVHGSEWLAAKLQEQKTMPHLTMP